MNDDFESKEEREASVFEGCVLIVIGIIFLIVILGVISEGRVTKPITDKLAETIKNNPEFFFGDLAQNSNQTRENVRKNLIALARAKPFSNYDSCVKEKFELYQSSEIVKQRVLIDYNSSKEDEVIKGLIDTHIIQKETIITYPHNLNDLDKLFNWDRDNGMKYIYDILDLMDRNYSKDETWSFIYSLTEDECVRKAFPNDD
jgi:hypothetical protein